MKTVSYKKTGKSVVKINNLKTGENLMKTGIYKKTDKGVVEISNNNSTLQVNSDEAVLLDVYQDLFDRIDKGSKVINFVKTKEYKDSLLDSLQNVIERLLESKEYIGHKNIKGLFKRAFYNRTIDLIRYESTYDIFRQDFSEYCQDNDYGITKQYLNEMLIDIKSILSISEYQLFRLYHVKGFSTRKIAVKLEASQSDIARQIVNINNQIAGEKNILNFSALFDQRYVAHNSGKKKRQHKRKVLTQKEIIELSGKPYKLEVENYTEPKKNIPEFIPLNKVLQYPTKKYFEVIRNDFGYINESKNEIDYVSSLTYNHSKIELPVKVYSQVEYRRKRYIRQYQRTLKKGQRYMEKPLVKGWKSHVELI